LKNSKQDKRPKNVVAKASNIDILLDRRLVVDSTLAANRITCRWCAGLAEERMLQNCQIAIFHGGYHSTSASITASANVKHGGFNPVSTAQ
jgi:hypothetical protein